MELPTHSNTSKIIYKKTIAKLQLNLSLSPCFHCTLYMFSLLPIPLRMSFSLCSRTLAKIWLFRKFKDSTSGLSQFLQTLCRRQSNVWSYITGRSINGLKMSYTYLSSILFEVYLPPICSMHHRDIRKFHCNKGLNFQTKPSKQYGFKLHKLCTICSIILHGTLVRSLINTARDTQRVLNDLWPSFLEVVLFGPMPPPLPQ